MGVAFVEMSEPEAVATAEQEKSGKKRNYLCSKINSSKRNQAKLE